MCKSNRGDIVRTLKFIVNGQTISLDPECDFSGLMPGTEGYLIAKFSFSPEWTDTKKVAAFFSNLGREFEPQIIKADRTCIIPVEALAKSIFKVQVIGQKGAYKLSTNKVKVYQKGGRT